MFGTKKKLMAAVVMLVISAIMMTSASYAWFTISTNPEITSLTAQVVVNEYLEIALANTNGSPPAYWDPSAATPDTENKQYTWGSVIDLSETAGGAAYDTLDMRTLRPALLDTTASNTLKYPQYDNGDGRVTDFANLSATTRTGGFGNLVDVIGTDGKLYGYYVDFWLKSNVGGNVTLSAVDTTRSAGSDAIKGGGSVFTSPNKKLADNIGIAFKEISEPTTNEALNTVTAEPAKGTVGTKETNYTKSFTVTGTTTGYVVDLEPNEPTLVRMYIYLDGTNVTNDLAATDNDLADMTNFTGTLNIQFGISDVNNSMDAAGIK